MTNRVHPPQPRSTTLGSAREVRASRSPAPPTLLEYYTEAGPMYEAWSPGFHMHFGYWRRGLSLVEREPMLREMTSQVVSRLALAADRPLRVADLGCGLGASARWIVRHHPTVHVDAVTLVPWQIEHAGEMVRRRAATSRSDAEALARISFHRADYRSSGLPEASFDGLLAIESACHDRGRGKESFLREAARLLRPGGRLVVADGFLVGPRPLPPGLRAIERRVCAGWALETFAEIGAFRKALAAAGLEEVSVEEIGWRVAPTVAQVPWTTLRYALGQGRADLRVPARRGHLVSCLLGMLLGAARQRFGYYLVTARQPGRPPGR